MTKNYDSRDISVLREHYVPTDQKTWPYFPIIMPSLKGKGPVTPKECDDIAFEVWDQMGLSVDSFEFLCDANERAMTLNNELFDNTPPNNGERR